jgi:uncharacterized lipoprotein YbaY
MKNIKGMARNVEVWIFGAFVGLVLAACLDQPAERAAPASQVSAVQEVELAQPGAPAAAAGVAVTAEPVNVVYVVGKRPGAAEKRAARGGAG